MGFHELYNYILIQNSTLSSISNERVSKIQQDLENYAGLERKEVYYPVTFLVVMQIIMGGGIYLLLNEYVSDKVNYLIGLIEEKDYFFNKDTMMNTWLLMIFGASFSYMWVAPIARFFYYSRFNSFKNILLDALCRLLGKRFIRFKLKTTNKAKSYLKRLDESNPALMKDFNIFNRFFSIYSAPKNTRDWFLFFVMNVMMMISFSIFMKGHAYLPDFVIETIFYVILCLPLVLLSFLMILFLAYLMARIKSFKKHQAETLNSRVILYLTSFLINFENYFYTKHTDMDILLRDINKIKNSMVVIGAQCEGESDLNMMIRSRVELLISYIDEMKLDLILPNEFSEQRLREKIIFLINSFVEVKYGLITKEAALNKIDFSLMSDIKIKRSGFISLVYLSLLISLPILAWMVISALFHFQVDDVSKTLMAILYTIWSVLCVISHLHKLAPEAKELVMGAIQMFIPASNK